MDCFIIEDELVVAQSICEYFRLFELTCDYAVSYEEGLAYLKEQELFLNNGQDECDISNEKNNNSAEDDDLLEFLNNL